MINLGNNILLLKNNKLDNNTYLITIFKTLVIIDLSWNALTILDYIKNNDFDKVIIFYTHGHYDHIGDINNLISIKDKLNIYISKEEKNILLDLNPKSPFSYNLVTFKNEIKLYEDIESLEIENKKFSFIKTPGHSIGSTSIVFDNYIFSGDFLFSDCIGRIDLLTSSEKDMINSCKYFLNNISNGFIICPGHGEIEKFGNIKLNNLDFNWVIKHEK